MNFKNNQIESRFSFPVTLTTDEVDGGFTVTFRDLPEAITQGENIEDALNEAADCLEEAIANRVIRRLPIPTPSEANENEYLVTTPLQTSFKASIWLAMQEKNINQTQLAQTLRVGEKEVRRILDPSHNTKLETLERSLLALGKRPVLYVA
ncbi:type II toxin-antitoxin system HicB family antitoxin [Pleurocapsales cyanobacterium LEGE 10410]|nr:type II toxin-antitoxin system HicB family antitoxin [Pleurocapsales cyanobacterium LEGE 10410]